MIHHVFANRSNVGDWLSAIGIQRALGLTVTEHLCDGPFVPETLEAVASLGPGDRVVIGGGGLLMDYFTPFWEGFAAAIGRTPYAIWGVGLVDIKREASRPPAGLIAEISTGADLVVVRDELTREMVGVPEVEVAVCPSVLAVEPRDGRAGDRVLLHSVNYTTVGEDVYEEMVEVLTAETAGRGMRYAELNNRIEKDDRAHARAGAVGVRELRRSWSAHACTAASSRWRWGSRWSPCRVTARWTPSWRRPDWRDGTSPRTRSSRLPDLIDSAPGQPSPPEFVDRARAANLAIGERLRRLWG